MPFSRTQMIARATALTLAAGALGIAAGPATAQDEIRTEQVHFGGGQTGTTIRGSITGQESVSYTIGAQAGQTMTVRLQSAHAALYFNVYEPGRGPGDQALAVSEMTGPMVPEMNSFSAVLPSSGTYTISVYLYRAAARRGERADYTIDIGVSSLGDAAAPVQGDYADGLEGGPDFFEVATTGGGVLNLRNAPSGAAALVTTLARGTVVRNLGCRMNEGRRWCRIATLADPGDEGWAAGDFLVEAAPPATGMPPAAHDPADALVPGTDFHATGMIDCVRDADAPVASCDFGVKRQGYGNGAVTVFWPDGGSRVIFFENGTPVSYDQSQADAGKEMTVTRDGDNSIVMVGPERFVIPDAVIWGG